MNFDYLYQPYASNRYCLFAQNGMVATGSALASQAGLEMLKKGGNAIDAAIATAAALTVVEPTANGLGSDAFSLFYTNGKLHGMNASGYSPKNISLQAVKEKTTDGKMPKYGWPAVMVPGAVKGWVELSRNYGKLSLKEVLQPAISYAENGYPLSGVLALMWNRAINRYQQLFQEDQAYQEWFKTFTNDRKQVHPGDIVRLPNHAKTLRLIAETDGDAFYKGEIAEQFVRQSQRDGGYFCMEDLSAYNVQWVDPISVHYHGYDVCEIPPNGQGIAALMALNILKEFQFDSRSEAYHHQIEAMKIAFADAQKYVTDPKYMKVDYHCFLDPSYGVERAKDIHSRATVPTPLDLPKSGTVYLCTADKEGNMVSFIQSNYAGFGSGIVLEGYGVSLQNRGSDFSLNENDANCLAPHKKSYHTIIPGFLMKDGKPMGPFGVMGGYMQPQGHVQLMMNLIDFHLNPQMGLDAPRWQWIEGNRVILEPAFPKADAAALERKGHQTSIASSSFSFGRGEMILRLDNGVLVGATESRTDANIACY